MPIKESVDWHCKYMIKASDQLTSQQENPGQVFLQIEPYGFDERVYVITQPRGQFLNYNKANPTSPATKIFRAEFGRQFVIPAEYDIMVYFIPYGNSPKSKFPLGRNPDLEGKIRLRTRYDIDFSKNEFMKNSFVLENPDRPKYDDDKEE